MALCKDVRNFNEPDFFKRAMEEMFKTYCEGLDLCLKEPFVKSQNQNHQKGQLFVNVLC